MRKDTWRQANPKDQLTALLWALEGDLDNIQAGIASDKAIDRAQKNLEDVRSIIKEYMPSGEWSK